MQLRFKRSENRSTPQKKAESSKTPPLATSVPSTPVATAPIPQEETPVPLCDAPHEGISLSCLPTDDEGVALADFFKMFADPTRLRILSALDERDLCVCDLAHITDMSVSAISHQLALLRTNHLVTYRREGKNVYYALADDHVRIIIEYALAHIRE